MALYAPVDTSDFILAPVGLHAGICCDVVDIGIIETSFGPKHKVFFSWLIDKYDDDGRPLIVSKRYTLSLHEKSNLYHDISTWYNRRFSPEECQKIDLDKLVKRPGQIQIMHNERQGKIWADVVAVLPLQDGMKIVDIGDYVRHIDRPADQNPKDVRNPVFMHQNQPNGEPTNGRSQASPQPQPKPPYTTDLIDDDEMPF